MYFLTVILYTVMGLGILFTEILRSRCKITPQPWHESGVTLFPFSHTTCKFLNFPKSLTSSRPLKSRSKQIIIISHLKLLYQFYQEYKQHYPQHYIAKLSSKSYTHTFDCLNDSPKRKLQHYKTTILTLACKWLQKLYALGIY